MSARRRVLRHAGATLLGVLCPLAAAQPARIPTVGYLIVQSMHEPPSRERQAFLDGLRDLGYRPGATVEIVYASAENEPDFIDDVARDLVRRKPDVIVASGAVAVLAAKRATGTIPIVALAIGDPIGTGVVRALGRPEANVTGVSFISSDLAGKRIQMITEIMPKAARIAVVWDARNANARAESVATLAAVKQLGLAAAPYPLKTDADLQPALERMAKSRPDALYLVFDGGTVGAHRSTIADAALRHRIPLVSGWSALTEAGGLISYAPDIPALFRRAASYVQRLLKGASPRDLPFEQATTVELVINLATARTLGIAIPQALLLRADRVID
jgi:putative ABC transport system substrate-binding protein